MNKRLMCLYLACALVMAPCLALASKEDIKIDVQDVPLNTTVKAKYNAYQINVINNSKNTIRILGGNVLNGVNSSGAYSSLNLDSSGAGLLWAFCGVGGLFTFGGLWVYGLMMTPVLLVINKQARKELNLEDPVFKNRIDYVEVPTLQSVTFKTLVYQNNKPILKRKLDVYKFSKPDISLTIEDQATKETYVVDNKAKT